jgi:hypothetical protein
MSKKSNGQLILQLIYQQFWDFAIIEGGCKMICVSGILRKNIICSIFFKKLKKKHLPLKMFPQVKKLKIKSSISI